LPENIVSKNINKGGNTNRSKAKARKKIPANTFPWSAVGLKSEILYARNPPPKINVVIILETAVR